MANAEIKYKPEYVDQLPDMFKTGEDVSEVCAVFKISRQTFYDWIKKYPEFKTAYALGKTYSESWWNRLGRAGAAGKADINPSVWLANMKNKFDWKEKSELTGANGGPIETSNVKVYIPENGRD